MQAYDVDFAPRVVRTAAVLGAAGLLLLAGQPAALGLSFAAGLVAALLVWRGAIALVGQLQRRTWPARQVAQSVAVYLGKYLVIAALLYLLQTASRLHPPAFAAGATVPLVVVFLKAIGRSALPADCDPVPYYARNRKAGTGE
ncbi:MAG: hypothetical protein IT204_14950 [Fimbriimonadaceae bacterium]|nr:hypothetical protein [Fimbriimonadaceae bacterium]